MPHFCEWETVLLLVEYLESGLSEYLNLSCVQVSEPCTSADNLRTVGDNPSRHVALLISNDCMAFVKLAMVTRGILNRVFS